MAALGVCAAVWSQVQGSAGGTSGPRTVVVAVEAVSLDVVDLTALAATVAAELRGVAPSAPASAALASSSGPVYAALRRDGLSVGSSWGHGRSLEESVRAAVLQARSRDGKDPVEPSAVSAVELAVTHSYRAVELAPDPPSELTNVHRGLLGLALTKDGRTTRYSPTWMLATNRSFEAVLALYQEEQDLTGDQLYREVTAQVFSAEQVLVTLGDPATAVRMERGNVLVPVEAISQDRVQVLVDGMADWMVGAVRDKGRMTYTYWPSRGGESSANNMIRQWMATTTFGRTARYRDDPALFALARTNIDYNLDAFYREQDGLGLIVEEGTKVKLGAVALAARAIVEHPDRAAYADTEAALRRMVDHLWQPDGSFRTWYLPAGASGQENFYPGEALYLWSKLYTENRDPQLLDRFMRSFAHYRSWHLDEANRNPAFVPWHTQAYYEVWKVTSDARLASFVFEMNDWLLGVQQWDGAREPDTKGRFYDPDRAHFGPPHASATGVYLEGLIDAYRMADELGDRTRAEAYRQAIVRGLRSVAQLQFADDTDMFYVSQRDRVRGGIRTTVYDNAIRVDNVQHNLMAALKVLETFGPEHFRP